MLLARNVKVKEDDGTHGLVVEYAEELVAVQ